MAAVNAPSLISLSPVHSDGVAAIHAFQPACDRYVDSGIKLLRSVIASDGCGKIFIALDHNFTRVFCDEGLAAIDFIDGKIAIRFIHGRGDFYLLVKVLTDG